MPDTLKITSPFDGKIVGELPLQGPADVEKTLSAAHTLASKKESALPVRKRIEILEATARIVEENSESFALEAAREGGKPLLDSRVELDRAVQGIKASIEGISQLTGREIPMRLSPSSENRMAYTFREPIGVVAAVSAFNHPFNLIVHQVIPAIAVGCPVIIKPSLTTPLSCMNLVNSLYKAGLPENWCQVLICENEVSEKLVTDPRVDFFSFVGSARVGWALRSKLSPGTRCALEHGGAAPVILDQHADIDDALPLIAKGGFYHAGQVCVSVQRLFVHESFLDEVSARLTRLAEKLIVGDPTLETTEVGPLILEREVERVGSWVNEAKEAGGKILTGGSPIGKTCYAPTLILNPPDTAKVSTEEIFGPVVNIYSYKNLSEAIDRANQIPFSFQAAVFTQNLDAALSCVKNLNASAVMVNDHSAFRVDWMPFAGRNTSGLGVGGILPAMQELTEEKMMVIRSKAL